MCFVAIVVYFNYFVVNEHVRIIVICKLIVIIFDDSLNIHSYTYIDVHVIGKAKVMLIMKRCDKRRLDFLEDVSQDINMTRCMCVTANANFINLHVSARIHTLAAPQELCVTIDDFLNQCNQALQLRTRPDGNLSGFFLKVPSTRRL